MDPYLELYEINADRVKENEEVQRLNDFFFQLQNEILFWV